MPCAPRSHPASGDRDRDGWPGPRPTRPRPSPHFSSNFTIAIFWVRVSQKNVCQTHSLSIHLWETKPRWGKAKKKKKKKNRRLISRGGFVRNLRTTIIMLCTPLCVAHRHVFSTSRFPWGFWWFCGALALGKFYITLFQVVQFPSNFQQMFFDKSSFWCTKL